MAFGGSRGPERGLRMSSKAKSEPVKIANYSDVAIRVSNLSKYYQIYDRPEDRLRQSVIPRLQKLVGLNPKKYHREFWALKDISFEVKKGETIGIIGRNGAGKSTLLQMICGTLIPSTGAVEVNGRVSALLELGSGFNQDFTGRENVYMNAAILGLSNDQIDAKYKDIVDFADIGDFIDQPIKSYSSGMIVRLAFAVQSQVDPDILIVDEALAVGDAKFQAKCFEHLRQLKERGTSILLVTHSSEQIVTHCSKAILLDRGVQIETGEPKFVVNRYQDLLFGKSRHTKAAIGDNVYRSTVKSDPEPELSISEDIFHTRICYNSHEYRWGDGAASIIDFFIANDSTDYPAAVKTGERIRLSVTAKFDSNFYRPIFGVTIKTKEGITVYGANSETLDCVQFQNLGQAGSVVRIDVQFCCRLGPGDYFISVGIATRVGEEITPHDRRYDSIHFQVKPITSMFGLADLEMKMHANEVKQ